MIYFISVSRILHEVELQPPQLQPPVSPFLRRITLLAMILTTSIVTTATMR